MHIIMKDENKKKANESIQLLQQQMSNLIATYKQITWFLYYIHLK